MRDLYNRGACARCGLPKVRYSMEDHTDVCWECLRVEVGTAPYAVHDRIERASQVLDREAVRGSAPSPRDR
jgi:PHP family Zn ribbon phosphoesterase